MSSRKTLHPLQHVANNQQLLVGRSGFVELSKTGNLDSKSTSCKQLKTINISNKEERKRKKKVHSKENRNELENRGSKLVKVNDEQSDPTEEKKSIETCCNEDTSPINQSQSVTEKSLVDIAKEVKTENDDQNSINQAQEKVVADAIDWITCKDHPEGYWQALAEERERALEEVLIQNEELRMKLLDVERDNEKLVRTLEETLDEAKIIMETNDELTKALERTLAES